MFSSSVTKSMSQMDILARSQTKNERPETDPGDKCLVTLQDRHHIGHDRLGTTASSCTKLKLKVN